MKILRRFFSAVLDLKSRRQRMFIAAVAAVTVAFNFFWCAVSIESDWFYAYPLEGSVDDYGCYPQVFDAFMKGRTDIDTDYDLSVYESLSNPYDTPTRRAATGENFGVTWDRAYYGGKLYSYFGVAPVILLYFPAYFITGKVLSDALAAAMISSFASVALELLLCELLARTGKKIPLWLSVCAAICLPFGALLYPTLTNANFYHIAVLAGIASVSAAFLFLLYGEKSKTRARRVWFALSGLFSACIIASRPNMALYLAAAIPLIAAIIIKRPRGAKSALADAVAYAVPALAVGTAVMIYNAVRFGSPFDFGNNYQLTLWDMSKVTFSFTFILPAIYHYFLHLPSVDGTFPFIHPGYGRLQNYGVNRSVYVSGSVGAAFLPCTWGAFLVPFALKGAGKKAKWSAFLAAAAVFAIAVSDMSYAGVHLRYEADIAFVCALGGAFGFAVFAARLKESGRIKSYRAVCGFALAAFVLTALTSTALCFDNERDMILKFHRGFYDAVKSLFD